MNKYALMEAWEDFYKEESSNRKEKRENYWNSTHIIDENQSIVWNKEQIIKHNREVEEKFKKNCASLFKKERNLQFKTFEYFRDEYSSIKLNKEMFEIVWAKSYDRGHSEGIYRIFDTIEEYLDFFSDMIEMSEINN